MSEEHITGDPSFYSSICYQIILEYEKNVCTIIMRCCSIIRPLDNRIKINLVSCQILLMTMTQNIDTVMNQESRREHTTYINITKE